MDARTRAIIIVIAVILILAGVIGLSIYLLRLSQSKAPVTGGINTLPKVATTTPGATTPITQSLVTPTPTEKTFIGSGYTLKYPANWGILICSNSKSIEFDPTNPTDSRDVSCDVAQKPITILVTNTAPACRGDQITLGPNQVTKSVSTLNGDTDYRWCLQSGSTFLDITERVSSSGSRATSTIDYSGQVEEMIKTITPPVSGS